MVLHYWAWYTLKLSKSKCKILYNFMGNTLIFQFLYINVLNYCYFHTDCSTFFKNKKTLERLKKTLKTLLYRKIKKRSLQLWSG